MPRLEEHRTAGDREAGKAGVRGLGVAGKSGL
jgi:hypothetical protein